MEGSTSTGRGDAVAPTKSALLCFESSVSRGVARVGLCKMDGIVSLFFFKADCGLIENGRVLSLLH